MLSVPPASTDAEATALAALQAKIAERKRKRDSQLPQSATQTEASSQEPKKVKFSDKNEVAIIPLDDQKAAFQQSKADKPPTPPAKPKTKAKARYLKKKLERRKAKKKAEGKEVEDKDQPELSLDERRARKKELKAARRAKKDPAPASEDAAPPTTENVPAVEVNEEEAKAKRKAERKAKKEAKKYAKSQLASAEIEQAMEVDHEPAAQPSLIPPSIQKKMKSQSQVPQPQVEEEPQPAPNLEDALPRFPAPRQPAGPSQEVLDSLAVAQELRDAIVVNQGRSVKVAELVSASESMDHQLLSQTTQNRLQSQNIEEFFAVQATVIPILLNKANRALYASRTPFRDLCVSAPTGSGKTLSYVIPIAEILAQKTVRRLRALIVVPTKDLVQQVKEVFEIFTKGRGIAIGTVTGQHSFAQEQSLLTDPATKESKVDILICTPGRVVDHLEKSTNGFSLQHLRYLVVDEADRLLNQSFQGWLKTVLGHISKSTQVDGDHLTPHLLADSGKPVSTQKLLFSATLSRDPGRIKDLDLYRPVFIAVQGAEDGQAVEKGFTLAAGLTEHNIFTTSESKPLMLFHLLYNLKLRQALIFTKSVEAASRLVALIQLFEEEQAKIRLSDQDAIVAAGYSGEMSSAERKKTLTAFKDGQVHLLVCSDLIARGIDLPEVAHVISYDVAIDARKYVHRVGRTARAGRTGDAWSLVEDQEAAHFKQLLGSMTRPSENKPSQEGKKVERLRVKESEVERFEDGYVKALERLRETLAT